MQVAQHAALLGDHQQAGGVAVQAVHQLQFLGVRAQLAQRLDHAEAQAAAAMHGDAGRLVHHDQRLVFVDDGRFQALQQALGYRRRLVTFRQADGRYPHDVAGLDLVLRLDAPLVDPYFTLAQDAVHQGLGHALEGRDEEIVDALAGKLRRDFDQLNAGSRRVLVVMAGS